MSEEEESLEDVGEEVGSSCRTRRHWVSKQLDLAKIQTQ